MIKDIQSKKIYFYYNFCKTCYHGWQSDNEETFCPVCFTSSIVYQKEYLVLN